MENSKEQGKRKILDEDLAVASGGGCGAGCACKTYFHCDTKGCFYHKWEKGNHMGEVQWCPRCEQTSLRAESILRDDEYGYDDM